MERKMETVKKINVLGTQYTLIINADDELLPENADGAMDHSLKRIVIAEFDKPDRNTIKDLSVYRKKSYQTRNYPCIFVRIRVMEQ